jgi:hypothetical protein
LALDISSDRKRDATRVRPPPRALQNGAPNIERADKLVQLIAKQNGMQNAKADAIVSLADERLAANKEGATRGAATRLSLLSFFNCDRFCSRAARSSLV